jgi:hypothetical protein
LTALTEVRKPHHQATGFDQAKELDRTEPDRIELDRTRPGRACHSTLIHPLRLYPN